MKATRVYQFFYFETTNSSSFKILNNLYKMTLPTFKKSILTDPCLNHLFAHKLYFFCSNMARVFNLNTELHSFRPIPPSFPIWNVDSKEECA